MSKQQHYEQLDPEYSSDSFSQVERVGRNQTRRAPSRGRRGKAPQSFNGMHKRRKRKIAW